MKLPKIKVLTRQQARRLFTKNAKHLLGITGREFVKRWERGDYQDRDEPAIIHMAMLLPFWKS